MNILEYNTTNCEAYEDYWGDEDDNRFACEICGESWPTNVVIYPNHKRVCGDKHHTFHQAYKALNQLEHELLGDRFNALSVCLKLHEEGII